MFLKAAPGSDWSILSPLELQPVPEQSEPSPVNFVDIPHTSRLWTPIDNFNPEYMDQLVRREQSAPVHNYVAENKVRPSLWFICL